MTLLRANEFHAVVLAISLGFIIQVSLFLANPEYHTDDFVGFAVVYGWLGIFALAAWQSTRRRTLLLIVATGPLAVLAVISVILSFPIYVPPFLIMIYAIVASRRLQPL
jgi:hypothetical protein